VTCAVVLPACRALALLLAACAICTLSPLRARADDAQEALPTNAPAHVRGESCEPAAFSELMRVLRVELGAAPLVSARTSAVDVQVTCTGDQVAIAARRASAPARVELLELATVPLDLRPRIVALRIAEVLRDPTARAAPAPPSTPATALPPVREAATDDASRRLAPARKFAASALAQLSFFHGDGRPLWGAGLQLAYAATGLSIALDAALATRRDDSALGHVRVLSCQLAPQLTWGFALADAIVRLGAGYAFGLASLRGEATSPNAGAATRVGFWSAPFALAALEYPLGRAVRLRVQALAGRVLPAVIGEVTRADDVQISGVWTQLSAGAAVPF
jgi:hypothetical protein